MGLFSSSSRSSSTTNNTSANAPQQVSDAARAFNFQNLDGYGGISIESLDPAVISDALDFADQANQTIAEFSGGAIQELSAANREALEFSAGAFQSAQSALMAGMETNAALAAGSVEFAGQEAERTRNFSAGAIQLMDSFTQRALESNLFSTSKALAFADDAASRSDNMAALALLNSENSRVQQGEFLGQAFTASIDSIEQANKSETAALTEKALYAVAALGAVALFSRWA
jgi:hypothetical protein